MARGKGSSTSGDVEPQVTSFIDKFAPHHRKLIRDVRDAMRARFPTAYELVYDNYNFFVLGYGPTERPSDAIISIASGANGVGLCFIRGAELADPHGILQGEGKQTRFVRVASMDDLGQPAVQEMIDAAESNAGSSMRTEGSVETIIRSISAKQRPRRKP